MYELLAKNDILTKKKVLWVEHESFQGLDEEQFTQNWRPLTFMKNFVLRYYTYIHFSKQKLSKIFKLKVIIS